MPDACFSFQTCRTTFWTRFDQAVRPDEVEEKQTIELGELVSSCSSTDAVEAREAISWEQLANHNNSTTDHQDSANIMETQGQHNQSI